TAPYTFQGKLRTYQNKTLRYRGHYARFKALLDAGLLEEEPVQVGEVAVSSRQLLHVLLEPRLRPAPEDRDLVAIRVRCTGEKGGLRAEVVVQLLDYYDDQTGFTAMERTTGWHASIMAIAMAQGVTPRGAKPVELALPGQYFAAAMKRRGFRVTERLTVWKDW
ncbi:MAG: saccharopine dehydrogenase C-terminal domain-containing protein, partial [Bacillota bacterium]|nr:saccharopine dehydrogenase C-terminal domain-containing protein [Bacillota bacterium]